MFGNKIANGEIKMPFSAKECRGKQYKVIENKFRDLGFCNIDITSINDAGFFKKDGNIEMVTINGDEKFKKNQIVDLTSIIRITYHTKKSQNAKVINRKDIEFKGTWVQCHGTEEYRFYANVIENEITIYVKYAAEEKEKVFWSGTFDISTYKGEKTIIKSKNKKVLTSDIETALHCDTKEIEIENGRISFDTIINDKNARIVLTR